MTFSAVTTLHHGLLGAFAVEVADDVLALDADTPEAARYLEHELTPFLEANHIEAVLVASGGPGRRHFFARIADQEMRRACAKFGGRGGCEIRQVIRPPLAPHRSGHTSKILVPSNVTDALKWLAPREVTDSKSGNLRRNRGLSSRMFELIRKGDPAGSYRSRSEVVQAVALGLVNAGLSEESLWKMLTDPNNRAGEKVREIADSKGEGTARRYVARTYTKAVAYAAAKPAFRRNTDLSMAINEFERAVDLFADKDRFAGRSGSTDRAVIQGLIGVARRCGSIEFDLALRQLCEYAGISSRNAVRASMIRLEQKGLFDVIRRPRPRTMGRYRLRSLRAQSTSIWGCEEIGITSFASSDHDAWWARKGLWRIWRLLDGLTAREIAKRARISPRCVQQHLKRLREWELASCDDQRRYHRVEESQALKRVAELRGTFGRMAALDNRNRIEREEWNLRKSQAASGRLELIRDVSEILTPNTHGRSEVVASAQSQYIHPMNQRRHKQALRREPV